MEKVILTAEQANKLLAYLQTKPYSEVANIIAMIHASVVKKEDV